MQPAVYLFVRIVLSWLQYLERDSRAFIHSTQTVLVAGAAHSWAVVYALFVAVLARVARNNHYGATTYEELLPWWVMTVERVAAFAMIIWWLAGCLRLLIHLMEDDAKMLPVVIADTGIPAILKAARSPAMRLFLAAMQAISCTGLFLSVVLLCVALLVLSGSASSFELGLVFVASSFALPLSALALERMLSLDKFGVGRAALAAATETAALGPQFCVILALMDVRDHPYLWTKPLFPFSATVFVIAVIACACNPPRFTDAAVSPDASELAYSAILDILGVITLTLCFSLQSGWMLCIIAGMVVVVVIVCAALTFTAVRDELMTLLEPVMPLRSDKNRRRPGPWRDLTCSAARVLVLACTVVACWDVTLYASGNASSPDDRLYIHDHNAGDFDHSSSYDESEYDETFWLPVLLRLKNRGNPSEAVLIDAVSEALGVDQSDFALGRRIEEHRLVIMTPLGSHKISKAASQTQQDRVCKRAVCLRIPWCMHLQTCNGVFELHF